MDMDENIKSEEKRPSIEHEENKEKSSLFSSIGRLFSKLLNGIKNKIIDFLAVNPMPEEFPKIEKKAATARKNEPVGLFSLLRVVGKTAGFLLKSTWKYIIKPVIIKPVTIIARTHKPVDDSKPGKKAGKLSNNQESKVSICPKIRLDNGDRDNSSMHVQHPKSESKSDKNRVAQGEVRSKRENYKVTKL